MTTSCLYLVAEERFHVGQLCLELGLHCVSKDDVTSALRSLVQRHWDSYCRQISFPKNSANYLKLTSLYSSITL
jgi:hypothetical protein